MTPTALLAARKSLRLSQKALAERLGVTVRSISRWERGDRPIPPYLHLAIAALKGQRP